ncbi:unnamed protein product, partial [Effrenium voratum]
MAALMPITGATLAALPSRPRRPERSQPEREKLSWRTGLVPLCAVAKASGRTRKEPSALERFEERRRSWAQMRQRGLLGLESKIGDQVHQEENREERLRRQDENQKAELKRLSMEDLA